MSQSENKTVFKLGTSIPVSAENDTLPNFGSFLDAYVREASRQMAKGLETRIKYEMFNEKESSTSDERQRSTQAAPSKSKRRRKPASRKYAR